MNKTQVIYKVALSDGLYVANYSTALLSDEVVNVTVTNEISQSKEFSNKNKALRVAKYVKGFVIKYKLTVNSAKHEIIADYRGEINDPQTI